MKNKTKATIMNPNEEVRFAVVICESGMSQHRRPERTDGPCERGERGEGRVSWTSQRQYPIVQRGRERSVEKTAGDETAQGQAEMTGAAEKTGLRNPGRTAKGFPNCKP